MKTKEEILKMTKEELKKYKWNSDLDKIKNCFDCLNCSDCLDCSYCSNALYCRNLRNKDKDTYWICNVEIAKEEFYKKLKELKK